MSTAEAMMSEKKKSRIFLPALAIFLFAMASFARELPSDDRSKSVNGIYRGTLGREQIVVEIGEVPANAANENNGDTEDQTTYPIRGRYFYRRYGVDIPLVGMWLADGSLRLREYKRRFVDKFTAEWRLTFKGDQAYGKFCKCDLSDASAYEKPLQKISLKRISREFHWLDGSGPDLYDTMVLDFPLVDGPEIQVSPEISDVMRSDPRFKVSRPHLTRFPDATVMGRINHDMVAELRWDRRQATANLSQAQKEATLGGFYDETTTVSFFPPYVLSILVYRSWYWGGAHPNINYYVDNYDLRTGKRFDLNNAFKTASGNTAEEELAEVLAKLYMRNYVKPPPQSAPEDCGQMLRRITSDQQSLVEWFSPQHATLFLAQDGLMVIPAAPYAFSGCSSGNPIPYNELTPFVRKNTPFYLLLNMKAAKR